MVEQMRRQAKEPGAMDVPPLAAGLQRSRKRVRCDSCPREQDHRTMKRCSACVKAEASPGCVFARLLNLHVTGLTLDFTCLHIKTFYSILVIQC